MGDWGGCGEEEIFGPATLGLGRLAELPPSPRLRRTCRRAPGAGDVEFFPAVAGRAFA